MIPLLLAYHCKDEEGGVEATFSTEKRGRRADDIICTPQYSITALLLCTIVTHTQAHRGLLSNVEQEELNHSTKFYRIYCGVDNSVYLDTVLLFVVVEYF